MAEFSQILCKITFEVALNAEHDDHLGYEKGRPKKSKNTRNGYSSKTIKTEYNQIEIDAPRSFSGEFEPQLMSIPVINSTLQ